MSDAPKRRPVSGPSLPLHLKMGKQAIKSTDADSRKRSRSPDHHKPEVEY